MFTCKYCNYTNPGEERLIEHQEVVHEGAVTRCHICDVVIKFKSNLDQHIRAMHGTKSFPCDKCAWVSRSQVLHNRHVRDNHQEKPFKCETCNFRASTKSILKRHHHYRSSFQHPCDKCGKRFLYINLLNRHTRAGSCSKFSCADCSYKTDVREQWENHRKPEDCEILKNIKKKNTASKPQPVDCDLCYKTFSSPPSLLRHKRRIHGELSQNNVRGNDNSLKGIEIKTTVDSVEVLLLKDEVEDIPSTQNEDYSQEEDIFQKRTLLCPVGSCQFVLDSYDDQSCREHFQQSHTNVDFSQMTFLKLEI